MRVSQSTRPRREAGASINELAARDAFNELDHPKFDDFGSHALLVLHGLRSNERLDAARSALAETVDAYRAAEARSATEVSKVLTIYAAVLLPLSLVVGFFGMNHSNLPTISSDWGWIAGAVFAMPTMLLAPAKSRLSKPLTRGKTSK